MAEAYISPTEQIITQGDNIDDLKFMIQDALECHFNNHQHITDKIVLV